MDPVTAIPWIFWSWIVPLSIQAILLLCAAAIADRLAPGRAWPELRLVVGTILLLGLLLPPRLLPLAGHPLSGWARLDAGAALEASEGLRSWAIAAGWTWFAGVLGSALMLGLAARRLRRRWQRAEEAPAGIVAACGRAAARMGIARAPAVRLVEDASSPFVFGILQPRVVLPAGLRAEEIDHALLHELAHVRRRDLLLAATVAVVRATYWFHPLVHAAAARLADLRELCCDRSVARRLGGDASGYRATLLRVAARRHAEALAALPMFGGASLLARLRALEAIEPDRPRLRRALTLVAAGLSLACALPLAPAAERRANEVAELVERPPGCMNLRLLVMQRMAEERRPSSSPETP